MALHFIEFIQSHPELQLDIISKLVFLYIHFCMMTKSRIKLAKMFFRFFKNIIIEDKNLERKMSKFTKEEVLKNFGKGKFKMKLSKGTFLALRKNLESEKRTDILRIISLFFDIVEYEDEEEKLESNTVEDK
ncbi:hypothetical protein TNCT_332712 [Trichonephila clavata]|uniref:Uncharacterized protein n=1 Tax=Trichonephila clavata TaxID=2740835 RepID=A0A8X6GV82_TRICU|nr:hypothetical protein TNCT_332712 [Trichonephila clavata]